MQILYSLFVPLASLLLMPWGLFPSGTGSDRVENPQTPTEQYDVKFYGLDLNVSDTSTYLSGSVSIYALASADGLEQVRLELSALLTVDSVRSGGEDVDFLHTEDELFINLSETAGTGDVISLTVYYHGLGTGSGITSGVFRKISQTWSIPITYTLSEPFDSKNWFPCKQSLTDKADSVFVFLSTDNHLKAGSNGLLTASVPLPDNRIRYEWKSFHPVAYYLISFAVAAYGEYSFWAPNEAGTDSIFIQNYIYPQESYLLQNQAAIKQTGEFIWLFSDLFGKYPFADEKYGHCLTLQGGGMEHQTMTSLVNFSYLLVAHELAHQWFGNSVTCSTWQDIWVNEGFASYSEYLALQYLRSQEDADSWLMQAQGFIKSEPGGSVYLPADDASNEDRIFDYRLSYKKGAAIIHMIRQEVGDDALFFEILRDFLNTHLNGNASGEDFKETLENKTGRSFDGFFDQWYYGEGYPMHSLEWQHRNDTLYIRSLQSVTASTPLFTVLLEIKVDLEEKDTTLVFRQEETFSEWAVYLPGYVIGIHPDPNHWLLFETLSLNRITDNSRSASFILVPNPAGDRITIHFNRPVEEYTVLVADGNGRIVFTETADQQHFPLNLQGFRKGIYTLIVRENNIFYPVRFVKS